MGITFRNRLLVILVSFLLSSCADTPTYAPVVDIANIEPIISMYTIPHKKFVKPHYIKNTKWQSPVNLNLKHQYVSAYKGVDIIGSAGENIYTAQSGKVVYCGSGLRGYGNLIIIKHNNDYLSVYAHVIDVRVREGDWLNSGQIIATMGKTGSGQTKLYFEIRHLGKPLNPLILVPIKSV